MKDPQDPTFVRFDFRGGLKELPEFSGVNRENDAGAVRYDQFYNLENVRVRGDEIIARFGQSKVFSAPLVSGATTYIPIGYFDTGAYNQPTMTTV